MTRSRTSINSRLPHRAWPGHVLLLLAAACSDPSSGDGGDPPDAPPANDAAGDPDAPPANDAAGDPDAPPVTVTDPALDGPLQVSTQQVSSPFVGTVFTPAGAGPFPLIVVSSGFQLARAQYAGFCQHLASRGHVCITHDYPSSGNHQDKARQIADIIDWALTSTPSRSDAIGVAGHSLGGKVSINAAILDDRIGAVVGWDPVDALPPFGNDGSTSVTPELMGQLQVPFAVLGELTDASGGIGGMSCAPSADNYQRYFTAACAAPATLEVTIDGADHMDWIGDRGSCGFACLACASGTTADATVHTITRRVTAAWFERHLGGNTAMDAWLTPAAIGTPTSLRTDPGC